MNCRNRKKEYQNQKKSIPMDKRTALKTIDDFKVKLQEKSIKVKKIILFWSFATNRFTEISDIDLVVISDDFKNKSYWDRIDLLSDAIYAVEC